MKSKIKVKVLVNVSLLIALEVVLARFLSINTPIVRIGFGFLPTAICAMMYGPIWGGVTGAVADIIGATLFPTGAYFPGFTLSAALTGIVFGLFLYNRKGNWAQLAGAVSINCLGISLLLSTLWLSVLFGTPYLQLIPTRIVQNLIMIPIQFIILRLLQKPIDVYVKKQFA